MSKILLVLMAVLAITFTACEKEEYEGKVNEDGLTPEIVNLVPDEILDEIKAMGMPIYGGEKPPKLDGYFVAEPFVLVNSNIPNDWEGMQFADFYFRLYNQNNEALTIDFDYSNGGELGKGYGSYIVGKDDLFTVFVEVDAECCDDKAKVVMIISGKLRGDVIKDLYFANFMIDNYGNQSGYWIDNGQGRVIYDEDGFSPTTGPFKSFGIDKITISQKK